MQLIIFVSLLNSVTEVKDYISSIPWTYNKHHVIVGLWGFTKWVHSSTMIVMSIACILWAQNFYRSVMLVDGGIIKVKGKQRNSISKGERVIQPTH